MSFIQMQLKNYAQLTRNVENIHKQGQVCLERTVSNARRGLSSWAANISGTSIAKLAKGDTVNTEILIKVCRATKIRTIFGVRASFLRAKTRD